MFKIVDLAETSLTAQQWRDGNRSENSVRRSLVVDDQGDLVLSDGMPTLGTKVILEWEGDEPESLHGVGTNYTGEQISSEILKPEWAGLGEEEIPAEETMT